MIYLLLPAAEKIEKESGVVPVPVWAKRRPEVIRALRLVPAVLFVLVLKVVRCLFTGGCPSAVLKIICLKLIMQFLTLKTLSGLMMVLKSPRPSSGKPVLSKGL
jgi:hypothetical protein